jgi:hypothetical protein
MSNTYTRTLPVTGTVIVEMSASDMAELVARCAKAIADADGGMTYITVSLSDNTLSGVTARLRPEGSALSVEGTVTGHSLTVEE